MVPIFLVPWLPFAEAWHSVFAAWGLWLCVDGLAEACDRPSLLAEHPESAVWAIVISTFVWVGIEQLNEHFPVWTPIGFPFNPLAREVAVGLLGAPVVPTVLSVASLAAPHSIAAPEPKHIPLRRLTGAALIAGIWLYGDGIGAPFALMVVVLGIALLMAPWYTWLQSGRRESIGAGAIFWAAFDSLWSELGVAERFFVDYSSPTQLPAILAVCALMLVPIYHAAVRFLDKPEFDPCRPTP